MLIKKKKKLAKKLQIVGYYFLYLFRYFLLCYIYILIYINYLIMGAQQSSGVLGSKSTAKQVVDEFGQDQYLDGKVNIKYKYIYNYV